MCGRFVAATPVSELAEIMDVAQVDMGPPDGSEESTPRYNVAPQSSIWVVRSTGEEHLARPERKLVRHRWGLVPAWSKDPSTGARMFNARAESATEKSSFRVPLARRRCLIPADAFYEWKAVPGMTNARGKARKQPYLFKAADGGLIVFAGLWEYWKPHGPDRGADESVEGSRAGLLTCTILTTSANEFMSGYHDRMPVILRSETWDRWLSDGELGSDERAELLAPPADDLLVAYPVSPRVGDARAEGPELAEPVDLADLAASDAGAAGTPGVAGTPGASETASETESAAGGTLFEL